MESKEKIEALLKKLLQPCQQNDKSCSSSVISFDSEESAEELVEIEIEVHIGGLIVDEEQSARLLNDNDIEEILEGEGARPGFSVF